MIKINLLEETRQQVKAKGGAAGPKMQLAGNAGVILLLSGMVAAVAGMALWGFYVASTLNKLEQDIAKAQEEKARLEHVIKRNEDLQRTKDDLNRKINIIADLKLRQDLPVRLMDLVSRSLAEYVWLEELTYTGELVTIRGKAQTPIALANFLRTLEESPYFADVALQRQQNDSATGITSFDMQMTFKPAGKAPAATGASGPAGASAPPPA